METKKSIVIVATDFSEVAEYAVLHAAGICKMQNNKLTLLHIINKHTKSLLKKEKLTQSSIKEKLEKKAKDLSEQYGIEVDFVTREGSIFSTIGSVAKDINANLVLFGTHGKTGLQHLIGSYAMKVIVKSPAPVIAVHKRDFREGYKNVVMPIDDTSESKQKVKWAIHIAKKFNSTIHIFAIDVKDKERKSKIKGNLIQIKKFFNQHNVKHTDKICETTGSFPKKILDYSKSIDADLIMIMTNPDKIFPTFIIDQWEERVLFNNELIPVMAINPVDFNITVGGM